MKKSIIALLTLVALSGFAADSVLDGINNRGYGKLSLRIQSLSMYRDFEGYKPDDASSTTLGLQLGYQSPEWEGLSLGAVYSYAEPLHASEESDNGKILLSNGRINVLNEAWLQLRLTALGLEKTRLKAGRQVVNGEVFRADEFRQKPRSLEAVLLTTEDIPDTVLTIGHAWRLSNWMANEDAWTFNNLGLDVFKAGYRTEGITWGEAVYTGIDQLEVAAYDAYAYDVANLAGARAKYDLSDNTAATCFYRFERDVDRGVDHAAESFGASIQQKIGSVSVEPGYFGVRGDNLLFQETTTGINHPLGASMIICSSMFLAESDTAFIKATTKIGKTSLYVLYNYSWQDYSRVPYDGQELNVVVKYPVTDHFSVSVKLAAGYRDRKDGKDDALLTDSRLFLTYTF